jgi:hypothetical protein
MTTSIWPARRSGNRVLCGRQVAGRYVCQGEIATIWEDVAGKPEAQLPAGLTDVMGSYPVHWKPTARVVRGGSKIKTVERGLPGNEERRFIRRSGMESWTMPKASVPFTRDCPQCRVRNLVDAATLGSN